MAFTGDLGRVQGAGWFHTSAASSTSISVSSLQPQLTPFVGDAVFFPNGDVRQITGVSGSTVTLGAVMFSFKGDPGIGNATLSNTYGNSNQNGYTQDAANGIVQAKNYYNLGAFDTFVSNGDGTGTAPKKSNIKIYHAVDVLDNVSQNYLNIKYFSIEKPKDFISYGLSLGGVKTNKFVVTESTDYDNNSLISTLNTNASTLYFWIGFPIGTTLQQAQQAIDGLIIQYKLAEEYQYTEQVIENQPIRLANQEECLYWHDEWRKGLNLIDNSIINYNNATMVDTDLYLKAGVYRVSLFGTTLDSTLQYQVLVNGVSKGVAATNQALSFTLDSDASRLQIYINDYLNVKNIMLTRGTTPYPYEPYYGVIVREKDLSGIQLFPEGVNPAQAIGGNWEDEGTVTTSNNTILHAYRRLS